MDDDVNNNMNSRSLDQLLEHIYKFFECSVCASELSNTYVTKECAHRYCEKCIKESINLFNKCPICNQRLNSLNDVTRDAQFDDLFSHIKKLKERSEDKAFHKLLENTFNQEPISLSPLEQVLKKHLLVLLNAHQSYYDQLEKQYNNEIKLIDISVQNEIQKQEAISKHDIERVRQIIINQGKMAKDKATSDFIKTQNLVVKACDKYLNEYAPAPAVLRVVLKIRILKLDLVFENYVMQPRDDIKTVFTFIEKEVYKVKNDRIAEYSPNLLIFALSPFATYSNAEMEEIYKKYQNQYCTPVNVACIGIKECKPVLENFLKPGSELVFCGDIKLESEMPPRCFAKTWQFDDIQAVNYYFCLTCNLKWICTVCINECHKGHNTGVFILGNKPTWACCYCKRKNCLIANN